MWLHVLGGKRTSPHFAIKSLPKGWVGPSKAKLYQLKALQVCVARFYEASHAGGATANSCAVTSPACELYEMSATHVARLKSSRWI